MQDKHSANKDDVPVSSTPSQSSLVSSTLVGAGPSLHVSLPPNFPVPVETSFSPPSSKTGIGSSTASSLQQSFSPSIIASVPKLAGNGARSRSPFSLGGGSTAIYNPNAPFSPPETYTFSRNNVAHDSPGTKSAKSTPGTSMSAHSDPHEDLFRAEFRDKHRPELDLTLPPSLLSSGRKASVSMHLFKETSTKASGTGSRDNSDQPGSRVDTRERSRGRKPVRSSTTVPSQRSKLSRRQLSYLSELDDGDIVDPSLPPGLLSPPESEVGLARPATPSSLFQYSDQKQQGAEQDYISAGGTSASSRRDLPNMSPSQIDPQSIGAFSATQGMRSPRDPLPIPNSQDPHSRHPAKADGRKTSASNSAVKGSASSVPTPSFQRHSSVPETERPIGGWSNKLQMTRRQSVDEIVQSSSEYEDDDLRSIGTDDDRVSNSASQSVTDDDYDHDIADEDDLHMSGSEWEDETAQDGTPARKRSGTGQRPPAVVQLQPYNNQVGGHSSIFQFSKRAVCKPLVGRENEFYEAVEREHPSLLVFIPQYLGVLNVTFRHNENHAAAIPGYHRSISENNAPKGLAALAALSSSASPKPDFKRYKSEAVSRPQRKVFEGQEEFGKDIPEVSLDMNRHIAPSWMLRKCRLPIGSSGPASGRASRNSTPGRSRASSNARAENFSLEHSLPTSADVSDSQSRPLARRLTSSALASASFDHLPRTRLDPAGRLAREAERGTSSQPMTPFDSPNPTSRYHRSAGSAADLNERSHYRPSLGTHSSSSATIRAHSPAFAPMTMITRTPSQTSNASATNSNSIHGRGFTTVNQRLQEQVLREVFSSPMPKNKFDSRYESNAKQTARKNRRRLAKAWEESEEGERLRMTRNGPRTDLAGGAQTPQSDRVSAASGLFPTASSTPAIYRGDTRHPSTPPRTPPLGPSSSESMAAAQASELELDRDHSAFAKQIDEVDASLRRANLEQSPVRHDDVLSDLPEINASTSTEVAPQARQFLLMEDLTGRLKSPCVLDLKMGTRQYALDATDVKRRSQTKKCDKTTSRSHGVRICGMQVYDSLKDTYIFQDKYYGRKVLPSDFPNALGKFFCDGTHILVHHVPLILSKLYHLARIVWHLRGYRFYASSLLFIYDGDSQTQQKLEDEFDHRCTQGIGGKVPYSPIVSLRSDVGDEAAVEETDGRQSYSIGSSPLLGPVGETGLRRRRRRGEINIRIIDFAHCTTGHDYDFDAGHKREGTDALPVVRFPPKLINGPDSGYLFGLKNLAASFEKIWTTERERRRQVRTEQAHEKGQDADRMLQDEHGKCIADMGPLDVEGGQVFEEIFGNGPNGLDGYVST